MLRKWVFIYGITLLLILTYPDGNTIISEYDISGNLIKRTDPNGTVITNNYDELNRLISRNIETGSGILGVTSEIYTYDSLGRLTSGNDNLNNELSFSYDNNGNLVEDEEYKYYYDYKNRLVKVEKIEEENKHNKKQGKKEKDEKKHEKEPKIVSEYTYDVFGKAYISHGKKGEYKEFKKSKIGNTRLYTGREYDKEINLYYLRAGYYNADIGRFISRDPIDVRDDVNLYGYVGNGVVMFVDRVGREKQLLQDINSGNRFFVELVARNLDDSRGFVGIHTFIMIHSFDSNLKENIYTIGGHNNSETGKLKGEFNKPSDKIVLGGFEAAGYKGNIFINTPNGLSNKDFVNNIYNEYHSINQSLNILSVLILFLILKVAHNFYISPFL